MIRFLSVWSAPPTTHGWPVLPSVVGGLMFVRCHVDQIRMGEFQGAPWRCYLDVQQLLPVASVRLTQSSTDIHGHPPDIGIVQFRCILDFFAPPQTDSFKIESQYPCFMTITLITKLSLIIPVLGELLLKSRTNLSWVKRRKVRTGLYGTFGFIFSMSTFCCEYSFHSYHGHTGFHYLCLIFVKVRF